jgi:hypothetical protein
MDKNDLQTAVSRAEAKHGSDWQTMSQKERTEAIYRELRELDRLILERRHGPPRRGSVGSLAGS